MASFTKEMADAMSMDEKCRVLDIVNRSIVEQAQEVPSWHLQELEHRQKLIDAKKTAFISWDVAKKQLSKYAQESEVVS